MITNEKLAELVVQTEQILRAALRPGHIPINEAQFLSSPVAAMVLGQLIDDEEDRKHEDLYAGTDYVE